MEVVRRSGRAMKRILSPENLLAIALCLIAILLLIATSDSAPQWIYQAF
jgi:hypothetical protein